MNLSKICTGISIVGTVVAALASEMNKNEQIKKEVAKQVAEAIKELK